MYPSAELGNALDAGRIGEFLPGIVVSTDVPQFNRTAHRDPPARVHRDHRPSALLYQGCPLLGWVKQGPDRDRDITAARNARRRKLSQKYSCGLPGTG